jgi:hypothetical protein
MIELCHAGQGSGNLGILPHCTQLVEPASPTVLSMILMASEEERKAEIERLVAENESLSESELALIEDLRRNLDEQSEQIPWFLQSFVISPTDPLTICLLALVEDLPPIPGPKTLGTENYSRVFDAFMKCGWAGFEEAFDRIVPRDREDYAVVKRDLLREPVFNVQAHQHMADVVLGRKTVDEVFDEMARQLEQRKPQ